MFVTLGVCVIQLSCGMRSVTMSPPFFAGMVFVACATTCFSQEVVCFTVVVSAAAVLIFHRRLYKTASL